MMNCGPADTVKYAPPSRTDGFRAGIITPSGAAAKMASAGLRGAPGRVEPRRTAPEAGPVPDRPTHGGQIDDGDGRSGGRQIMQSDSLTDGHRERYRVIGRQVAM